jgi:hypothetical protein
VVSLRPSAALPQAKTALCPLNKNVGKSKSQCGHFGSEKILCPCQYFNPVHLSHSLDTIVIEVSLVLTTIITAKYSNNNNNYNNSNNNNNIVVVVVVAIVLPADVLHYFTFKFMNKNILTFCFVNTGDGRFASSSLGSDNDENFLFSPDPRFSTDSCL